MAIKKKYIFQFPDGTPLDKQKEYIKYVKETKDDITIDSKIKWDIDTYDDGIPEPKKEEVKKQEEPVKTEEIKVSKEEIEKAVKAAEEAVKKAADAKPTEPIKEEPKKEENKDGVQNKTEVKTETKKEEVKEETKHIKVEVPAKTEDKNSDEKAIFPGEKDSESSSAD